jgi:hypothetical protein
MKTYDYINGFMYFVIRPDKSRGDGTFIYCSGVNLFRFLLITKGRHGLGSNPAMRGLQLVWNIKGTMEYKGDGSIYFYLAHFYASCHLNRTVPFIYFVPFK